ncbi:MAG: response regulator [Gemmatimonadetes bacterium]|jgi:signal transduction histidine kinase|nr:response regulator [Gemmatimonadota bacterium]
MANILVVEDESIVGLDIKSRLQRLGHQVPDVVASGEQAIIQAEALLPELILMDIMLQGEMNGLEAADIIRERLDIPVIFLTAYSDESTLERAKEAGPYGYVLKPFKDRELYTTIELGLVKHQNERRLRQAHDQLETRIQERTAELARVNEELRREIEERKRAAEEKDRLAEQLRQSQKMEALGRLAAGVAHDFNNMLTIINGYSELVLACMGEEDSLYADVKAVKEAGERATVLTGQLLAFGRRQLLDSQVLDLNREVTKTLQMFQRLIGEDIELRADLQSSEPYVETDPGQFDQVLVNLVINARDSMSRGGRIDIETADVEFAAADIRSRVDIGPGSYVRLRVRDTGCGMNEDILSRVFEPFFTTKSKDKGTGLGLSVVYGIVEQSGGHIEVTSEADVGTTVEIFLPRAEGRPEKLMPMPEQTAVGSLKESILLVEDEDVVRELANRILCDCGYRVLEARKGEEALMLAELHDGPIHLLLTDVVMPEMSGRQLAENLIPLRPDMKILYMSGYTDDTILRYGIQAGDVDFLQKPFAPKALVTKVRQVLNQKRRRLQ